MSQNQRVTVVLSSDPTTLSAPAAAFAAAYATCTAPHSTVADTYRPLDAARHHHVTGATRPFYRPSYPVDRAFPTLNDLFADRTAGTIVHPSQRALSAAIDHAAYVRWWGDIVRDGRLAGGANPTLRVLELASFC